MEQWKELSKKSVAVKVQDVMNLEILILGAHFQEKDTGSTEGMILTAETSSLLETRIEQVPFKID